jgi:hypothetical protein
MTKVRVSLPETRPLPSVQTFAECKISGTRQRASLPSAALGKEKHTVNTAYEVFCAWRVHGKFPCPVCKEGLRFIWLQKGGKYVAFDKHRLFLPLDHPFRRDIKNFTKGVAVIGLAPPIKTSAAIRQEIDGLVVNPAGGFVGYSE